jgi:hypothetical protein
VGPINRTTGFDEDMILSVDQDVGCLGIKKHATQTWKEAGADRPESWATGPRFSELQKNFLGTESNHGTCVWSADDFVENRQVRFSICPETEASVSLTGIDHHYRRSRSHNNPKHISARIIETILPHSGGQTSE